MHRDAPRGAVGRVSPVFIASCVAAAAVFLPYPSLLSAEKPPPGGGKEDPELEARGRTPEEIAADTRAQFARLAESRSLLWDWMAIEDFAALPGDDIVPAILAELRRAPQKGLENRTHLLASAIAFRAQGKRGGTGLSEVDVRALLDFLRNEVRDATGYWLAYNTAVALAGRDAGRADLETLLADASRPAAVRAAVVLGLADAGCVSAVDRVEPLLAQSAKSRSREDQARLREAAVWAAATLCAPALDPEGPARKKAARRGPEDSGSDAGGYEIEEEDDDAVAEAWGIAPRGTAPRAAAPKEPGKASAKAAASLSRDAATRCMAAVAGLLDERSLSPRTRVQVLRALQRAWGTDVVYEEAESWRQVAAEEERRAAGKAERTAVRFFGIPSSAGPSGGRRVLFLLDGSDSMLTLLSQEEKDALWALLRDGAGAEPADSEPEPGPAAKKASSRGKTGVGSGSRSALKGIDEDTWAEVRTRFDAARAHLKHTLATMSPSLEFAVILFGDGAATLQSTPTFVKATQANRVRTATELDAIVAGPTDAAHPNGRLRGDTNIYEALALGLALGGGRPGGAGAAGPTPPSGASRTAVGGPPGDHRVADGCADTIYLLSDGIPTRDGFRGMTPVVETAGQWTAGNPEMEGEREVVINPETGATRKEKYRIPAKPRTYTPGTRAASMDATGPYVFQDPLVDEFRRRNLFARATLHVVAIGEAGNWLCAELARVGGGRCIRVTPGGERQDL